MRQNELWQRPVSYAAVGATQAADLLRYPPRGYRPVERRARIGHGEDRFAFASIAVMTWGVQRGSGMRVDLLDAPAEVTDMTYVPVAFDEAGEPVAPAATSTADEQVFAPDGTKAVAPGDTAMLHIPFGPFRVSAPVRVVYVVDEPTRRGFAYGTLAGHPEDGEEAWVVDRRDDGSVWITMRAFSRPSGPLWWVVYPVLRLSQEVYTRRYLRALAGPIA
ncbi:DUF1990 domain-containing protein [Galbitalea sp. SE-J8]|uniref:DUF1990 family protein n=1 Tax=Galbitalea sp. SE-J8 TaxID=3054952 RepID=UPI00259D2D34|nr:DUF1990 domain-containing protein [Galbitalea sp. SE-J8]MDM4761815.1 DUF1990 domain-containing protein [Galbitalea sp. SE-J8]